MSDEQTTSRDPHAPVAVIGGGSWGTTVAALVADKGTPTRIWARSGEIVDSLNNEHKSPYLPGISLPWGLRATTDIVDALRDAQVIVMAVPSHAFRDVAGVMESLVDPDATFVSLAKGIEGGSGKRMSQVLSECLPRVDASQIGVLSGPNLAIEIARRAPAATVVAIPDEERGEHLQAVLHTPMFRVYTNPDVVGVELGGAIKNAIAIAAGICDGLRFGDNAKAAIITRGLAEMTRLGVRLGGKPMTFSGLSGMGDLIATCMSLHSRNRHVGEELGKGRKLAEIIESMNMVAEGAKSTRAIVELAHANGVEMPICEAVASVLYEDRNPIDASMSLLARDAAPEFTGLDLDD